MYLIDRHLLWDVGLDTFGNVEKESVVLKIECDAAVSANQVKHAAKILYPSERKINRRKERKKNDDKKKKKKQSLSYLPS